MENKKYLFALDKNADIMLIEDYDFSFPEGYNPQVEDVVNYDFFKDEVVDKLWIEEFFENFMKESIDTTPTM